MSPVRRQLSTEQELHWGSRTRWYYSDHGHSVGTPPWLKKEGLPADGHGYLFPQGADPHASAKHKRGDVRVMLSEYKTEDIATSQEKYPVRSTTHIFIQTLFKKLLWLPSKNTPVYRGPIQFHLIVN